MSAIEPRNSFVISGWTAGRILSAPPGPLDVSLDLGRTRSTVRAEADHIVLPDGAAVARTALADSFTEPEDCIELTAAGCRKVYLYSETTRKYYKLYQPAEDLAPTVVIAGATMHTIVETDPWSDAAQKVAALPVRGGQCLDTCFGLGYSAQLLAKAGFEHVVTCEVDPNVLECAAVNPWSRPALEDPRVEPVASDVREVVAASADGRFGAIFHDPPTVHQAGELYGAALYAEFARVLAPGGGLYHYVGSPGGRHGRDLAGGVIRRLREAGFTDAKRRARGVLCRKGR